MIRTAFTLLEMLIVIIVMALIASSATLSFKKPLQRAAQSDAVQMLKHFDHGARQLATQFARPVQMSFDLEKQSVSRLEHDTAIATMHLPQGVRITELRTADRHILDFEHPIPISESGISMTYALHLGGNEFDQWILFTGMTGDFISGINESELDNIFKTLTTPGAQRADTR